MRLIREKTRLFFETEMTSWLREKACVTQTTGSKVSDEARDGGGGETGGCFRPGQGIQKLNAYVSFLRPSLATEQRREKDVSVTVNTQ